MIRKTKVHKKNKKTIQNPIILHTKSPKQKALNITLTIDIP